MSDLHVTHHVAGGLKLGPKLGPFPVGVWLAIIAAGLYVAHRRASSATSAATDTSSTDTSSTDTTSDVPFGVSTSTPVQYDGGAGGGVSDAGTGLTTDAGTSSAPTDNLSWASAAISALVKAGTSPITANNAVDRYLTGDVVSDAEAAAINRAITLVGPPPEGAPPVNVAAPAPAIPTPAATVPRPSRHPAARAPASSRRPAHASSSAPRPTRGGRYTVKSGDTLFAIAGAHHVNESQLYATNRGTIEAAARHHGRASSDNGHWIYPGTVLVLP